jgi:hypothetical protein
VDVTRDDAGVWTVRRKQSEKPNPFYDEALPRYLATFERVFAKAS